MAYRNQYYWIVGISLIVFCCAGSPVSGNLVVWPIDTVAAIGQSVQLDCSTNDNYSVNWWHVPVGSITNEDVFISSVVVLPYYPRFKVQKNKIANSITEFHLVITSVSREDAGKYTCIDRSGHGEQREAQLVVLESSPQCQTNIGLEGFVGDNDCGKQPEEIRCSCSLQYFGNNYPVMEWMKSDGQLIEPQPSSDTSQSNILLSNLKMKPLLDLSGTSILWRAKKPIHDNWTSAEIKILYVMKNTTELNVTHGESIACSANSSEKCSYIWTRRNGTIVSESATVTIVETGSYFCDATCPLGHDKCTVRSLVAEFKDVREDNTTKAMYERVLIAVGVIIGICLVSAGVLVVICHLRFKRRKKKYIASDEELHLLNQLKTKNLMVVGVTAIDGLMYVAHHSLNVISVYWTTPSFKFIFEIKVDGLSEPCDMAACPLNSCLYITDSKNRCVWKMRPSDGRATKWMENICKPFTISVCSNGNVVMVQQPNTIVEYNAVGSVVEKCEVLYGPKIQDIQHAVKNTQGNFIIGHGGKHDKVHDVCEVSKDGGMIRSYGSNPGNGPRQLRNPRHVAVDRQDRVYVVDAFNDRVLQLDKKLQTSFKLPCSACSQPLRLAINDGKVLIGKYGAVNIFSICDMRSEQHDE